MFDIRQLFEVARREKDYCMGTEYVVILLPRYRYNNNVRSVSATDSFTSMPASQYRTHPIAGVLI